MGDVADLGNVYWGTLPRGRQSVKSHAAWRDWDESAASHTDEEATSSLSEAPARRDFPHWPMALESLR